MAYYLAIDLGTTGCRSILFDEALNAVSLAYEEYGLITQKENRVEQDASLWWELTLATAKKAIGSSNVKAEQICGISVSSQGITLVPVDKDFHPLCNAISWLDARAEKEAERIRADYDADAFFALTGKPILSAYTLPKILWLRENEKDIFAQAEKLLMPMDFLIARLTGKAITDPSMASGTLMYDLTKGAWCDDICRRYGIDVAKLPTVAPAGTPVGRILPAVAKELGLSEDCLVAVGAQDQKCAAFGVGLSEKKITVSLGTAAAITRLLHTSEIKRQPSVSCCGYISPNTLVAEGVVNTAGTCLRYLRDLFYPGESYATIDREVALLKSTENAPYFYAHLGDEGRGPSGAFFGISLDAKRCDYAHAVMEGVAFELRMLLDKMGAYRGDEELILFGGGAVSDVWCQMIADVTALPITVPSTAEAAGAGAARLAAMACGHSLPPLCAHREYTPTKEKAEFYSKRYERYLDFARKTGGTE